MVELKVLNSFLTLSCLVGLGLSIYAYTIELSVQHNPNYQPLCDISEQMSCSKAFKSPYGKGFGLFKEGSVFHKPNSLLGIVFYSLLATLAQVNSKFIIAISFILIALSNIASIYFAYILYFVLYNLCVVCVAIYVVNFLNLMIIHFKLKKLNAATPTKSSSKKNK